jgi:hypothetical protein
MALVLTAFSAGKRDRAAFFLRTGVENTAMSDV